MVDVKGVFVFVRKIGTGRVYLVNHDQLTNQMFYSYIYLFDQVPKNIEKVARSYANPVVNPRERIEDFASTRSSPETIIRTRGKRVVHSARHPDFENMFT